MRPVTLHVSLAPKDWRHARVVLPHQLRQWGSAVDDVQLTVDLLPSVGGLFGGGTEDDVARLRALLDEVCAAHPEVHVREVDYGPQAEREVSARFFGGRPVPRKSHYGAAFYSYFYGWHTARHDLVLHTDSDVLYGGGSSTWLEEAVAVLEQRDDVVVCSPLPGPPTADGRLPDSALEAHSSDGSAFRQEQPYAFSMASCSTRVFLMDRAELVRRIGPLRPRPPRPSSHVRARLEGHVPVELPEAMLGRHMRASGQRRLDLLGEAPGRWSLHPPLRSPEFYAALPGLVERVERGDVPEAQRGDFDVNDSMVDWTSARAAAQERHWRTRWPRAAVGLLRGAAVEPVRAVLEQPARGVVHRWRRSRSPRALALRVLLRGLDGPLSDVYGFDRGVPVDRPYVEQFLERHRDDVRGRVLEVKSDAYARRYGAARTTRVDVVDVDPDNPRATLVADLDAPGALPEGAYDCIVLTQTLQFLTPEAALPSLWRALAPGGVLLLSVSALVRQETPDSDRWRVPPAGLRDLLARHLPAEAEVEVEGRGNAVVAAALVLGLAVEEVGPAALVPQDWRFPVVSTARVRRPG